MIRFPQISPGRSEKQMFAFDSVPYAKINSISRLSGNQVGFLTEHTAFFILKGSKHIHLEDEKITVKEGQMILLGRGIYTISESIPKKGSFEALMIFFPDKLMQKFDFDLRTRVHGRKPMSSFSAFDPDELLLRFRDQYLSYLKTPTPYLQNILSLKIQELILLLLSGNNQREAITFLSKCFTDEPLDVEYTVRKYVLQPLSLAELAAISGRSLASFKRDFTKKFRTSPRQWINTERLNHAARLLQASSLNVSQIACECGFESSSYFIRLFRNRFKATPQRFRTESATK